MKNITIIVATSGKNYELAQKFKDYLHDSQTKVDIVNVSTLDLPLYVSEHESKHVATDLVGKFVEEFKQTTGFVILLPEYNGGLPASFINFISWISRASKDWRECFNNKPCAIGSFSGGGGQTALSVLRLQLAYIGMNVIGRQIIANNARPVDEASVQAVAHALKHLS